MWGTDQCGEPIRCVEPIRCGEPIGASSDAIRCNQRPSEVIRCHQRPSEVIRGHQRPSVVITCGADWPPSAADRVRYAAPSTARATRPIPRPDPWPSSGVPPVASSTRHARLSPSLHGRPRAPHSYLQSGGNQVAIKEQSRSNQGAIKQSCSFVILRAFKGRQSRSNQGEIKEQSVSNQ